MYHELSAESSEICTLNLHRTHSSTTLAVTGTGTTLIGPLHRRITRPIQRIVIMIWAHPDRVTEPSGSERRKIASKHKYSSVLLDRGERQDLRILQFPISGHPADYGLHPHILRAQTRQVDRRPERHGRSCEYC